MRSETRLPAAFKMFPGYLRDAGYYCVNNGKEDYNLQKRPGTRDISIDTTSEHAAGRGAQASRGAAPSGGEWRACSVSARSITAHGHWRTRKPGQPFLAVSNDMATHESQLFQSATNPNLVHDPAKAWLAALQPDTIEMRRDWAQYHDQLTLVDRRHQARLDELEKDGLLEDTVIVVASDHGSGAVDFELTPEDVRAIEDASSHIKVEGARYSEVHERLVGR